MIGLEWGDVNLASRQLSVRRSNWNGQVGTPKGGRQRPVPLTRLTAALPERKRFAEPGPAPGDARYLKVSSAYRTPLYRAVYRQWLDEPRNTLWMAGSLVVADAIDRCRPARLFVVLGRKPSGANSFACAVRAMPARQGIVPEST
jgi:hypothetical protein